MDTRKCAATKGQKAPTLVQTSKQDKAVEKARVLCEETTAEAIRVTDGENAKVKFARIALEAATLRVTHPKDDDPAMQKAMSDLEAAEKDVLEACKSKGTGVFSNAYTQETLELLQKGRSLAAGPKTTYP